MSNRAFRSVSRPLRPRIASILVHEDGAAMLEFALILPILIVMCIGAVEIGRVVRTYAVIENAVRGGTRSLAQVPDPRCQPACSWAATRAIDLTRAQIVANSSLRDQAIRIRPSADIDTGTVAMEAEVDVPMIFSGAFGRFTLWTVRIARREPRIAG